MRERLMQLLGEAIEPYLDRIYPWDTFSDIADHLLDNGVIVPPCKIGDKIWFKSKWQSCIEPYEITNLMLSQNKKGEWTRKYTAYLLRSEKTIDVAIRFAFDDIGKHLFLTREAAEAALKARENSVD